MTNDEKLREIRANLIRAQTSGPLTGELLTDVIASIDTILASGLGQRIGTANEAGPRAAGAR